MWSGKPKRAAPKGSATGAILSRLFTCRCLSILAVRTCFPKLLHFGEKWLYRARSGNFGSRRKVDELNGPSEDLLKQHFLSLRSPYLKLKIAWR